MMSLNFKILFNSVVVFIWYLVLFPSLGLYCVSKCPSNELPHVKVKKSWVTNVRFLYAISFYFFLEKITIKSESCRRSGISLIINVTLPTMKSKYIRLKHNWWTFLCTHCYDFWWVWTFFYKLVNILYKMGNAHIIN